MQAITSHLSRQADKFSKAMVTLAGYEADAVISKTEFDWLKSGFNNALEEAWRAAVNEPFTYDGKWEALRPEERALEQALSYPMCHTAAGYLRRVEAATKAAGAMRDAMLALLRDAAPLGARVQALKDKIGKRAPKPTKTSMARDARSTLAMTCQCCARDILAETGQIAHHGYERPGDGWQTASCPGALELPFEVARDALGVYIVRQREWLKRTEDSLAAVIAESRPLGWTFEDKSTKPNTWTRGRDKTVHVTRDTFQAISDETSPVRQPHTDTTFDRLKAGTVAELEMEIRFLTDHINMQQGRYDGWTQTHTRRADKWERL